MKKSGTYAIRNKVNGKFYAGSSVNLTARKHYHFDRLKRNKHPNPHLQHAFNKYTKDNFDWEILKLVEVENLLSEEQQILDENWDKGILYNIARYAGRSSVGRKLSEESRKRCGQRGSEHHQYGKKREQDVLNKISITSTRKFYKRRLLTDEQVREIRNDYNPTPGGGIGTRTLAKKYGVSRQTIKRILCNSRYKHELKDIEIEG